MPITRPNYGEPKEGRVVKFGSSSNPPDDRIFRPGTRVKPIQPRKPTDLLGVGRSSSLSTSTGIMANDRVATADNRVQPMVNFHAVASQAKVAPATNSGGQVNVAPSKAIEIQPQERGSFFQPTVTAVQKRAGGPDPANSTPFHPNKPQSQVSSVAQRKITAPESKGSKDTSKRAHVSFMSTGNHRYDSQHPERGARWSFVKKGVVQ